MAEKTSEKRRIQRVMTTQQGRQHFRVIVGGESHVLLDLSLEGFAVSSDVDLGLGDDFEFRILRDGDPHPVTGRAQVVNRLGLAEEQVGCRIFNMDDESTAKLRGWLSAHVLGCAAVPITKEESVTIVTGPSIV